MREKFFFVLVVFVPFFGCKNAQRIDIDGGPIYQPPNPYEYPGVPPEKVLFDFTSPIYAFWVANDKLSLKRTDDNALMVQYKEAGKQYECWGTQFRRNYDFSEKQVLKLTVRMEADSIPELSVQLKDKDGIATNKEAPTQRLIKSAEYIDYYFSFENKWVQSWPKKDKVDNTNILEILFFINAGKADWTGTLFIDKIETMTVSELPSDED